MNHVLVRHKVKDYAAWKKVFDDFEPTRRSFGEKTFAIYHTDDEPNNLYLLFGFEDRSKAEQFFKSSELEGTMKKAGVAEAPTIQFIHALADGTL